METFLGRYKNLIVLAAILFAQLIGLALQVKLPGEEGETRLIRFWAVAAVTPLEKAVVHSEQWVRNLWTGYIYLRSVRRENEQLKAQIERMKLDNVRLSEDARMAQRVQALLAFKEQYIATTTAAQVIGTSGSEQSRVIYIDKGSRDGIKPDMAVITPTGIVGKIVQVFPESSQVLPINDQLSGVGAALKDTRLQGILRGASNGATTLQYVMADEKVALGEDVITSGGDRIFPKGLPVGKVADVQPGKDLFLNIRVIPAAHLDRLEEVLVVTQVLEKGPDTKDLGPIRAADILAQRLPTYKAETPDPNAQGANPTGGQPNAATPTTNQSAAITGNPAKTTATGSTAQRVSVPPGTTGLTPTQSASFGAPNPAANAAHPAAPKTTGTISGASTALPRTSPSGEDSGVATKPAQDNSAAQANATGDAAQSKPNTVKKVIVEADPEPPKSKPATPPEGSPPPQ